MAKASDLRIEFSEGVASPTCGLCGEEFDDHGVLMSLMGGGICGDHICGACIGSGPKGLAKIARARAEAVREMRPEPDDDPDLHTKDAKGKLALAKILDGMEDFTPIQGGIVAAKIAEGYLETERPKKTGREAA
jgi:hypothetical protein